MRNFVLVLALGVATSALAQEPAKPAAAQQPAATPELDKDTQTRQRAERSAGGTGKITPEEKANANVGAGPHTSRRTGPARRPGEQSEPAVQSEQSERDAQSSRGATR